LTRNPILKVLSTLCSHEVRYLLMGGQACVLYGGAEFSRHTDVAVLADAENLDRPPRPPYVFFSPVSPAFSFSASCVSAFFSSAFFVSGFSSSGFSGGS